MIVTFYFVLVKDAQLALVMFAVTTLIEIRNDRTK